MSDPFQPEGDDGIWTGPPDPTLKPGLFLTDRQLIKRLGVSLPVGYRALHELDRKHALNGFPQKDPLWGNRRLWPKVVRWLMGDRATVSGRVPMTWEGRLGQEKPRGPRQEVPIYDSPPRKRGPALDQNGKRKLVPRIPPPDAPARKT